jgi:hypothetical protein
MQRTIVPASSGASNAVPIPGTFGPTASVAVATQSGSADHWASAAQNSNDTTGFVCASTNAVVIPSQNPSGEPTFKSAQFKEGWYYFVKDYKKLTAKSSLQQQPSSTGGHGSRGEVSYQRQPVDVRQGTGETRDQRQSASGSGAIGALSRAAENSSQMQGVPVVLIDKQEAAKILSLPMEVAERIVGIILLK